jgi:hypothetical protein
MFKRLLQAATLTVLLNLLAHFSQPDENQPHTVLPSQAVLKLVMNLR